MNKKIIIIFGSILIIISIALCIIKVVLEKDFYVLKNDKIKKITTVVGKRKLVKKTKEKRGDTIIKTFEYRNIENPYSDLSMYINYLEENSHFIPTKNFSLEEKIGDLQISRYSTNKDYIIIIEISYNAESYTIKITRGKGKLNLLNNS